jgi:uncharacterized repeat protein (TIGR01451 family)
MNGNTFALLCGLATLLAPALCHAQGYNISTVAGGGNPYYYGGTGDGAPATLAGLANPCYDVAVDGSGNLYIVAGSLIRKVTTGGIISTVAGGGTSVGDYIPATQASLAPTAIAVDSAGNLFIADNAFGTSRIRIVDSTGNIRTLVGGAVCCALGDGGLAITAYIAIPWGLAVDRSDNVYIAQSDNSNNNVIRMVSAATGNIATVAGGGTNTGDGGPATSASLSRPLGVAVDSSGNLYIAEAGANRIRKVSKTGTITTVATLDSPWHVTLDSSGNLYVTQPSDATVSSISPAGAVAVIAGGGAHGFSGDGGPATNATMDRPGGIATGSHGLIYIADATNGTARVRLLTPAPSLTITSAHTGNFTQRQTNATYTLTVSNATGAPSTSGTVTVTESVPTGLTLVSMSGKDWTCPSGADTCTRGDALAAGASYPAITVTVNVAANAPASVTNQASVSGGGSAIADASDVTTVKSPCDVGQYGTTNVADVQTIVNEALGHVSAANDLNRDGEVNVIDVQIAINAALGLGCWAS